MEIITILTQSLLQPRSALLIANILILLVLIILNGIWIYLIFRSIKNGRNTPSIDHMGLAKPPMHRKTSPGDLTNSRYSYDKIPLPFVSIIVPARNEQEHITKCLTSLLNQNYPAFEIIAVDDSSTDNTPSIIRKIQADCNHKNMELVRSQQQRQEILEFNSRNPFNSNNSTNSNTTASVNGNTTFSVTTIISAPLNKHDFILNDYNNKKDSKLKIISLKAKPKGWTGKTWASQQGYLCSKGDILIFTDADTCYINKDTIASSISYFRKENLDVLTGFPLLELKDFWSKMVNPIWNLIGTLFGYNLSDINDPNSKAANLMGSFIVIKRSVFENIGTYKEICNNIREDEALGIRTKQMGYKIRAVLMDRSLTALWSKDVYTLWHGVGRTIVPSFLNTDGKKRSEVIKNLLIIFLIAVLPFILLPYCFEIAREYYPIFNDRNSDKSDFMLDQHGFFDLLHIIILLLNLSACMELFVGSSIKAICGFKISPVYSIVAPFGAIFLVVAYVVHIFSATMKIKSHVSSIVWRDKEYHLD